MFRQLKKQKNQPKAIAKAFFGTERITRTTVFWCEAARQLCKLGWIQIQILHNNLLSWSLAFWTELSVCACVFVCECGHNFHDYKLQHSRRFSCYSSTWINQENFQINNPWLAPGGNTGRVFRSACARHVKDTYHSSWETSCSASARLADEFKTQLEETEVDDGRHLRENSRRCGCGGGFCKRWEGIKKHAGVIWKQHTWKDRDTERKEGDSDQSFLSGH